MFLTKVQGKNIWPLGVPGVDKKERERERERETEKERERETGHWNHS